MRPRVVASDVPKRRRMHVGSCSGRVPLGYSAAAFLLVGGDARSVKNLFPTSLTHRPSSTPSPICLIVPLLVTLFAPALP
eukprot:8051803-Pyramimonas_sp.AAC.1